MRKTLTFSMCLFGMVFFLSSCVNDNEGVGYDDVPFRFTVDEDSVEQGIIRVKLDSRSESSVNLSYTADGIAQIGIEAIDNVALELKATKIERTFWYGGKFEQRRRAEGLHLWYDIHYDASHTVTRAYNEFASIEGVSIVEPSYKIVRINGSEPLSTEDAQALIAERQAMSTRANAPFNDQGLDLQWHYSNDASLSDPAYVVSHPDNGPDFIEGADINVFRAWDITTGDPRVIVAIMDDGIELTHEDLAANIWYNTVEKNGAGGVDDDNNGYVDDVNGWNFVNNKAEINPGSKHGTHVAGTIGAVNNNGKGVCGIAGGNSAAGQEGVKLMSCQIFNGNSSATSSNKKNAYLYAADNGAVISQNSWSYTYNSGITAIPDSDKEAIDYFIKYAGIDENGIQTGPLEGGIVIFAASNDGKEFNAFPASYERILAVASMGPAFTKSHFSNWGSWVDITAPGGNAPTSTTFTKMQVYSTVLYNDYGYDQGTSMACPHVSGVAALLVSKFGTDTKGISGNDIWKMLVETANPDLYTFNPTRIGKLGAGYVDAYAALTELIDNGTTPVAPSKVEFTAYNRRIDVAITVTANGDGIIPNRYQVFCADRDLSGENLDAPGSDVIVASVRSESASNGSIVNHSFTNLKRDTKYYIVVRAWNVSGQAVAQVSSFTATTQNVNPPADVPDFLVRWSNGVATATWRVTADPDDFKPAYYRLCYSKTDLINNDWTTVEDKVCVDLPMASYSEGNLVTYKFRELIAGESYFFILIGVDARSNESNPSFAKLFAAANNSPKAIKDLPTLSFGQVGQSRTLDMTEYFYNDDGFVMDYQLTTIPDGNYLEYTTDGNNMTITSKNTGSGSYKIVATDFAGLTANAMANFNGSGGGSVGEIRMYPNPVYTDITISIADYSGGTVNVSVFNTAGARVMTHTATSAQFQVNMSKLSGGNYIVVVKCGNSETKRTITKL